MRILIADDSVIIRLMLEQALTKESGWEVVASVTNGRKALDAARNFIPDLIISDYDMPEINGLELADKIRSELKIPVVIFSENSEIKNKCFINGVKLFIQKPDLSVLTNDYWSIFIQKIKEMNIKEQNNENNQMNSNNTAMTIHSCNKNEFIPKAIVLGASTGGPAAVAQVASALGNNFPLPILFVQHIEVGADESMVSWFNSVCTNITFKFAEDNEITQAGYIYMAPAGKHLVIKDIHVNGNPILKLSDEPEERFLKPAVNKLFRSASDFYGKNLLAILLTGMGRDGAEGCKKIVENGGYTIVEDKSTCVVFGMPAAAIEIGAAVEVLPRNKIPEKMIELCKRR